jgi:hypothetical protein
MSTDSNDLDLGSTIRGFSPGQKVFGRFTLTKILGRGGMGVVWLARDEELEREVALKFLPELLSLDRESVAELKKETRRNLDLTHTNIVRIYDFVQDTRAAAISMEYINGTSLSAAKVDREGGVFPLEEVRRWTAQVCEALSYAHEKAKVVHRDLKPANLMIDAQRQMKITDFGIACSISDSVSRVSKNIGSSGTPIYMSPQQMLGEKPAPSDDIYSLGATLFEMLSGKPPFHTGNILLQVQSKVAPTIQQRREELGFKGAPVPAEWEQVIASCLAKDAAARPLSVAAIAVALGLQGSFTAPVPAMGGGAMKEETASAVASSAALEPAESKPVRVPLNAVQRRNRNLLVTAGVVIAVGAGVWIGDMPNRYQASQQQKEGQMALLSSDWKAALIALRESATLRPTDVEYRFAFDDAQKRWLEMLQREIQDKAPRAAYDTVMARAGMTGLFIDPHAETFARLIATTTAAAKASVVASLDEGQKLAGQHRYADSFTAIAAVKSHAALVADFSAREDAVKVAEVQHGIALALESMDGKEFQKAYNLLDGVKTNAALVPGYEIALRRVRETEVRHGMALAVAATEVRDFAEAYSRLAAVKTFASLVSDYEAGLQTVRESEVRHEIGLALALAEKADFAASFAALDKTAGRAVLPDDVAAGKGRVRALAEARNIDLLGKAIVAGQADSADAIIADYARFTDSTFTVAGRDLVGQRDLDKFLTALQALRIRPAEGQKRVRWLDVILVAAARKGFEDSKAVRAFLAENYIAWSRSLAEQGAPATAIYVNERARQEGATTDERWEKATLARLPALASLAIKPVELRSPGGASDSLQSPPVRALLRNLGAIYGSWASSAEAATVLSLNLSLGAPKTDVQKLVENKSVRYQSGTRQVENVAYAQRKADVDDAIESSNAAQRAFRDAKSKADSEAKSGTTQNAVVANAVGNAIVVAAAQYAANQAANSLQSARATLASTPRTLTEAVYSNEPYKVITHRVGYSLNLRAQSATSQGRVMGEAENWSTGFAHETVEVVGDARRNVPVRDPQFPSPTVIANRLNDQLAKEVNRAEGIALKLSNASMDLIKARAVERKLDEAATTEQLWGVALLWGMAGVTPSGSAEIERRVRRSLGFSQ